MPRSDEGGHAHIVGKCELICIDPAHVHEFWPHVAPLIEAAMLRGAITDFAEVVAAVLAGRALVWIAWNGTAIKAAAVTQLSTVHGVRFCTIVACGGRDRREWLPLIAGLERYAKSENCKSMRIFGRRGWERLLPDYTPARVLLQKELT
jgi:hypothetical protein